MDGSKEEVAPLVQQLLVDKADLLKECFSVEVNSAGQVSGLPQLIEGHCPDLDRLPYFVLQLARDVDWEEEKACFRGLAQVSSCYCMATGMLAVADLLPASHVSIFCSEHPLLSSSALSYIAFSYCVCFVTSLMCGL